MQGKINTQNSTSLNSLLINPGDFMAHIFSRHALLRVIVAFLACFAFNSNVLPMHEKHKQSSQSFYSKVVQTLRELFSRTPYVSIDEQSSSSTSDTTEDLALPEETRMAVRNQVCAQIDGFYARLWRNQPEKNSAHFKIGLARALFDEEGRINRACVREIVAANKGHIYNFSSGSFVKCCGSFQGYSLAANNAIAELVNRGCLVWRTGKSFLAVSLMVLAYFGDCDGIMQFFKKEQENGLNSLEEKTVTLLIETANQRQHDIAADLLHKLFTYSLVAQDSKKTSHN